jgi:hypothetical protein
VTAAPAGSASFVVGRIGENRAPKKRRIGANKSKRDQRVAVGAADVLDSTPPARATRARLPMTEEARRAKLFVCSNCERAGRQADVFYTHQEPGFSQEGSVRLPPLLCGDCRGLPAIARGWDACISRVDFEKWGLHQPHKF